MSETKSNRSDWLVSPIATRLSIRGKDPLKFANGLCTNQVRELEVGAGCEAFFTTVQGKILSHAFFFRDAEQCLVYVLGEENEKLIPHLQKYAMIEDVDVVDRSDQEFATLVLGGKAKEFVDSLQETTIEFTSAYQKGSLGDLQIEIAQLAMFNVPAYEFRVSVQDQEPLLAVLSNALFTQVEIQAFHELRVANRFPWHGVDLTDANLAQEAARNETAISFTKGCYLGQEPIARIDALGHVNKQLVALQIQSENLPNVPLPIEQNGKSIGTLTSVASLDGQTHGIGMLRREFAKSGSKLEMDSYQFKVL